MLKVWSQIGNTNNDKQSFIWYNTNLKVNRKLFLYHDFYDRGLQYISDMYYTDGGLLPFTYWQNKGVAPSRWFQWHGLVDCLRSNTELLTKYKLLPSEEQMSLLVGDRQLKLVTSKHVYTEMMMRERVDVSHIPRISKHIQHDDIEWKNVFGYLKLISDTKSKQFQYKFLHDILVNNYWLKKWNIKDSEYCEYCQNEIENLEHVFWTCVRVRPVIDEFIVFCRNRLDCDVTKCNFFLGDEDCLLNNLIVICKAMIYNCKINEEIPNFIKLNRSIKYHKLIQYEIAKKNNTMHVYIDKWARLGV